ncbi:MAG: hypothetical protein DMF61_19160 [Blastocatellia bacterium AA13]|nr:MAG: hypothetical protein DMF61_19160 [Blastocatellia bacterium AA13]
MRILTANLLVAAVAFSICAGAPASALKSKLYVTNSAGDDVTIIDTATLKVVGSLKVGESRQTASRARLASQYVYLT